MLFDKYAHFNALVANIEHYHLTSDTVNLLHY